MKPKHLSLFSSLGTLGSLTLLIVLTSAPSAKDHAALAGLSGPRLVIAALLLASTAVFTVFWLLSTLNPAWIIRAGQMLDDRLRRPETLLVVSFYLSVITLTVPALVLLGISMHFGQVIKRAAELLIWAEGLVILLSGVLAANYGSLYRRPGFFADAPRKIMRASFIGRPGFWLSLGLLVMTSLVLIPASSISMNSIPNHDSGIFLYFGQQILHGQIPFRDLWDHKPPMIFYVDALGLLLGRGSIWGVWALEYLALAGSSLMGFWTLSRYYRSFPAALAICLSLNGIVFLLEGGNFTEEFSLPLQWAVLILFAISHHRGWGGRGGFWRAFATGMLFGLALNFKQTMVGIWVALFLWLGLYWLFQQKQAQWKVFAWAFIGVALTQATIALYFAAQHSLSEYWRVAFVYNLIYSDIAPNQRVTALVNLLDILFHTSPIFPLVILAWVGGVLTIGRSILRRELDILPFPLLAALIDLPIEIILISASGKNYRHYFMTLIPVTSILMAWAVSQITDFARQYAINRRFQVVLAALGILLIGLILAPSVNALVIMSQPSGEMTITDTVSMIKKETQPGDYVLVWGSQTVVNFLSGRLAPTRFVHQKALFRTGFTSRALSDEMLHDLQARTPQLIINTHLPSTPFISIGPESKCYPPPNPPDGMDAVFQFICQNYTLDRIITKDRWEVYRLQK